MAMPVTRNTKIDEMRARASLREAPERDFYGLLLGFTIIYIYIFNDCKYLCELANFRTSAIVDVVLGRSITYNSSVCVTFLLNPVTTD